jgi:hypothetical protein
VTKIIFVGYSEETKGYKLYDPVARKIIMSRDVQFVENEAWDGSITNTIIIINAIEHDNTEEEVVQTPGTSQCAVPSTTATQIPVQSTPVRSVGAQSTPRAHQTLASCPSSSTSLDQMLAGLLPRKTRSMCDIYNEDTTNSFSFFALFSEIDDPLTFEEDVKDNVWAQAMDEEIKCIENNQTWNLVDVHEDTDVISVKWIYKTKQDADGNVQKHKLRLVAIGFTQQRGIDFNGTFAPVAHMETVRTLLAIVVKNKWSVYQMDVKSTFLNGHLEEEVYVEQPQGYEVPGKENKVYRLTKALYGLKQALRAWYSRIDSYLIQNGFQRSECEPTMYIKANQQGNMLIVFYM